MQMQRPVSLIVAHDRICPIIKGEKQKQISTTVSAYLTFNWPD